MSGDHISVISETSISLEAQVSKTNRILIIDDDKDILEGYKYIFECEGFKAYTACTPSEALMLVDKEKFDTILLDYMLPSIRGDELAERLLEISPSSKLVIISGFSNVDEVFRDRNIEIQGILWKPVDPERLLDLMKKVTRE